MERLDNIFDFSKTISGQYLTNYKFPWEILPDIEQIILKLASRLDDNLFDCIGDDIWVAKNASVASSVCLNGPLIIDQNAEIRHCAYIRGKAIIGKNATVGNSCEVKNSILFDSSQIPHFNYVGDSIIGYKSHIGAGGVTSNLKSDKSLVSVKFPSGTNIETNLKKFGAILGDYVEVGCNSVLNPGTIIDKHTNVYPVSCVRGYIPPYSIYKNSKDISAKRGIC